MNLRTPTYVTLNFVLQFPLDTPILKSMDWQKKHVPRSKVEAFDLYDRIKSTVGEYCDDWILVGKRCDNDDKVIIGTTDKGWGDLKPVYDNIQKWKEDALGDS